MENIKEDDILMCTVKKIEASSVFVDIDGGGEGSIVYSEIAAGRIRNIRVHVSIGKKIVCKVLKVYKDHVELSLRRVTSKERDEIKEKYEKERNLLSMLKTSIKNPEEILKKIKQEYDAIDFLEEAKQNPKIVEKFIPKSEQENFKKILTEKKEKEKEIKKIITIKSLSPNGINDIKSILEEAESKNNLEIHYLGSSKFSISSKARDFKEASSKLNKTIEQMKTISKNKKLILEVQE